MLNLQETEASNNNPCFNIGGKKLKDMIIGGANLLKANAEEVNRLNVFPVPDGDTGDNMRMTVEGGISTVAATDTDDIGEVMNTASRGMLLGARGNSGVILSQFFAGIAKGLTGKKEADAKVLAQAFELGVKQAYSSVMTPTEGTILTVAREGVEYASARVDENKSVNAFFEDLLTEMRASLDRTPDILPVLREAGVVDSGGAGLLYIIEGLARALNGEVISSDSVKVESAPVQSSVLNSDFGADSEMKYGYCTEFLLQLRSAKTNIDEFDIDELKEFLQGIGDSIVAFKTDSIVKVHVHTFSPDKVLAYCLVFGDFLTVKIENMSVQHTELEESKPEEKAEEKAPVILENTKKYGVVAVSNGEGISSLFKELGCDEIVEGGQTQNPSTHDFLDAFDKIPAENIFVFPNNSNILMAARQAALLYTRSKIHVIPSKNIGSGYAALASLDFFAETPDKVVTGAVEAMKRVTSGYIAPSIRDAKINGVLIYKGDTIGIIEKEIVISEKDRTNAAVKLASRLLEQPDKFMLTVFCGKDASDDDREALETGIREKCPDAEIYFNDGGQEIYPFIFVAE
ncbi:MAG: DAK2 domain-containing protein [Clostridia bacterium]|nr:DAK2 domain-containing protein [Clostridia bacterium]